MATAGSTQLHNALTLRTLPDLPVHGADVIGLPITAEMTDNPGPRAAPHRLDAFGIAHERLESGDQRVDVPDWRQNAVVSVRDYHFRGPGARSDHRVACSHRFEHRQSEPLDP